MIPSVGLKSVSLVMWFMAVARVNGSLSGSFTPRLTVSERCGTNDAYEDFLACQSDPKLAAVLPAKSFRSTGLKFYS
jgi:hypothetical protein